MELLFNELSYYPLATSIIEAETRFVQLLNTFKEANKTFGFKKIQFHSNHSSQLVTADKTFYETISLLSKNDLKRTVLSFIKKPFVDDLEEEEMDKLLPLTKEMGELIKKNQTIPQAKVAYLLGEYWHYQEEWLKGINYLDLAIKGLAKDSTTQLLLAEAHLVRGYCLHELEDFEETIKQQIIQIEKEHLLNAPFLLNIF